MLEMYDLIVLDFNDFLLKQNSMKSGMFSFVSFSLSGASEKMLNSSRHFSALACFFHVLQLMLAARMPLFTGVKCGGIKVSFFAVIFVEYFLVFVIVGCVKLLCPELYPN